MATTFTVTDEELAQAEAWLTEHNKTCAFADPRTHGAIGGRLTYSFTPTGLGPFTNLTCACGDKVCLTDFDRL